MQRTITETTFTYVVNEIDENNQIIATIKTAKVAEKDVDKAYKMAVKKVGNFVPVRTEQSTALYVLDDEVFFSLAKKVEE